MPRCCCLAWHRPRGGRTCALRATRCGPSASTAPLRIDGRLDDEIYAAIPPIGGFIQQLPREGDPATEPTEVWIFFDDDNVYVAARCLDSQPDRIAANELRRDNRNIFSSTTTSASRSTRFHDRRNGFFFQTNPIGAVRDQAITDGSKNVNWNTVWDVKARGSTAATRSKW